MINRPRVVDRINVVIRWLSVVLVVSLILNAMMFIKMSRLPDEFEVYTPPDLSAGGRMKVNTTPKHAVYSFAYRFWQLTESCLDNCADDAVSNITTYRNYMSPAHYRERLAAAEVRQRSHSSVRRTIEEYEGYSADKVTKLATDVWVVNLKVVETDRIGDNVISERVIEYPVRIIAKDISINANPWRLGLDGFQGSAKRINGIGALK